QKSWHKKYCQLFPASQQGIERLEVFENEEDAAKTHSTSIITLESCIKITQDPQKSHVFVVMTKTSGIHHFAGNSEEDMLEWMSAFQSVAFKDTASRQTIEEDNDLYCSTNDFGVFSVNLVPTEASKRCGLLPGRYTLVVAPAELQLRDPEYQRILLTWPYKFIRRYGHKSGWFKFEAGRKCTSGEGIFYVEHANLHAILRCMQTKMQYIRSCRLLNSAENIMCGDNQLQHAMGMSARSRSPLPPSPTSVTPFKPKPRKPPRKHPPLPSGDEKPPAPPPTATYDDIEVRNDLRPPPPLPNGPLRGKVFIQQTTNVNNYDKLQHFGSTTKLNAAPGYRQITSGALSPLPPHDPSPPPPDTDPPSVDTIQSARSANDSHNGYGVIRKKSVPSETVQMSSLEYAFQCIQLGGGSSIIVGKSHKV
ncbi:hypothetical protein AAG570_002964, partial [Ranatra chinensis]